MGGSTVSRRVSEFVGVALFAAALIWIISLASYEPTDPVWFFSTGAHAAPANFAGRVGAFLAELSFQLFGYASYLIPAVMVDHRLELLLVPDARRGRHEGHRRRAAVRRASARSSAWCSARSRSRANRSARAATSANSSRGRCPIT